MEVYIIQENKKKKKTNITVDPNETLGKIKEKIGATKNDVLVSNHLLLRDDNKTLSERKITKGKLFVLSKEYAKKKYAKIFKKRKKQKEPEKEKKDPKTPINEQKIEEEKKKIEIEIKESEEEDAEEESNEEEDDEDEKEVEIKKKKN